MAKTYIDANGYRRFSDSNSLVSRWMAERKIGRKLRLFEPVHHINRNKLDNKPSNIWAFVGRTGYKRHTAAHKTDKRRFGWW